MEEEVVECEMSCNYSKAELFWEEFNRRRAKKAGWPVLRLDDFRA